MATISDVRVKLVGDSTRLQKALGSVSKGLVKFGQLAKKVAKGVAAAFVAIGATVVATALQFQKMNREIVVGTGASGKQLQRLNKIGQNLFTQIAVPAKVIGQTLASVQTISGLTGDALEGLTGQILKLSNLTGGDANRNALQFLRGLQAWKIPAQEGEVILDKLFKTTQTAGISFEEITQLLREYQASLSLIGLGMDESIGLLGRFSKAGLTARKVMPGLTNAVKLWAGENKNAGVELAKAIQFIKTTTDEQAGLNEAFRIFGTESGAKAFAVIRSGVFTLDDLAKGLDKSKGALDKANEDAKLFTEEFTLLFRKVQVLLTPFADIFVKALDEKIIPAIEKWIEQVKVKGPAAMKQFVLGIANLVRAIGPATIGVVSAFSAGIKLMGVAMFGTALAMQGIVVAGTLIANGFDRQSPAVREAQAQWERIAETSGKVSASMAQDFKNIIGAQGPADAIAARIEKLAENFDKVEVEQKAVKDEQKEITDGVANTATKVGEVEGEVKTLTNSIKIAGNTIKLDLNDNFNKGIGLVRQLRIEMEAAGVSMGGSF